MQRPGRTMDNGQGLIRKGNELSEGLHSGVL